ncbi:pentatricopeptide repeat-containing protein At3g05340 isoform X2 [Humulus lupulus]|uniref:pentatricopeptide repeat-containing protein At3g05340 isoform X2 n=1 Tax=Humulus lupulus TaxID=3486 RepID=UPI002B413E68|nr:pentatricopeptide repeat-containing protein At3g05340 isoform X2 [Humulus lupulus]
MNSRWVFLNFNSHLPSWASSVIKIYENPSPRTSRFVLNHVDISRLLSHGGREGDFYLSSSIHASMIKISEFFCLENGYILRNALVVWNSLLSAYSKRCDMLDALKLFDEMPTKDTVSWNTVMSGFLRNGQFQMSFEYFKRMHEWEFRQFDKATLTTILSALDGPEFLYINRMIHGLVIRSGYELETTVGNSLITSYFKSGCSSSARRVFDEMFESNVITWTAMISGLAQTELFEEGFKLFVIMRNGTVDPNSLTYLSSLTACSGLQALNEGRQIHALLWKLGIESDLHLESALMDMYSKCGSMEDAWRIFESAEELDEVSMTVILVGCAQNGLEEEAIQIFKKMVKTGIKVDPNMVSAVLGVFNVDTSLGLAFARHGDGFGALQLYEKMKFEGVRPTDVTFLSLLHACSHVGLVEKGMEFLNAMAKDYGLSPRTEHYACVVDMLGRAGLLKEAKKFIEVLPENPGPLVWQALLGACSFHSDSELGKYAAEQLVMAAPDSPAPYVLLANIYSSEGNWKERARTIKRMKEMGVVKETGISWVEIEKKVHSFVVWDRLHPQAEIIYGVLAQLFRLMTDEGYVPNKRFILYCLDPDENR